MSLLLLFVGCQRRHVGGGGHAVGGVRTFTRKRWRELQELIAAEQAAEAKARSAKKPAQREALARAAEQAQEVIAALEAAQETAELAADAARLARTLEDAASMRGLNDSLAQAAAAEALGRELMVRISEFEQDEEDATMMVLLS